MKLLLYIVVLIAVLLVPSQGTDVGKLIPVEVLAVSESNGTVTVRTDTDDLGQGRTLAEAFENLEETAPGVIYLDTAEFLLLETGMEDRIAELGRYLKKGVRVCMAAENLPLEGIADYLSVHDPGVKLEKGKIAAQIPTISEENGRYTLK